jgi:phosphoribosylformylglycinamidine synthase
MIIDRNYTDLQYDKKEHINYLEQVLQLEAVACKDWLTNKVDRCVGGKVAKQQTTGPLLPLNNCGVMALDYLGKEGVATSMGHSPVAALIDPVAGSRTDCRSIKYCLGTYQKWYGRIITSANWMWACKMKAKTRSFAQR